MNRDISLKQQLKQSLMARGFRDDGHLARRIKNAAQPGVQGEQMLVLIDGFSPQPARMVAVSPLGTPCDEGKHCAAHIGNGTKTNPNPCCRCGALFVFADDAEPLP